MRVVRIFKPEASKRFINSKDDFLSVEVKTLKMSHISFVPSVLVRGNGFSFAALHFVVKAVVDSFEFEGPHRLISHAGDKLSVQEVD